jgi:formamidopyrimidine-DNA glycosylase
MPELPEIETVKLQLSRVLPGKVIEKIEILKPKSFIGKITAAEGRKVVKIERKAKLLLIDLTGDISLAIHFKMTGQLIYVKGGERLAGGHPTRDFTGELPSKHTRVIFHFSDGGTLYFNDQRIFGWVMVGDKSTIYNLQFIRDLGPEPIDMREEEFEKIISVRKKPVKLVLMDQSIISGVGNIYANDALWEAKINPRRTAKSLRKQQYKDLFEAVNKVLREGIKYGGATAADAKYIDLNGMGGHYQEHFRVYDREGETCLRDDGGIIHKFAMGGRGTYFCPKCQK